MNPRPAQRQRRIVYIDHVLQKWLLVAMVVLEAALTAFAIFGLYWVLGRIIDDSLYRIHLADSESMVRRFLFEGALILGATGVVNLSALVIADRIWAVYVRRILGDLDRLMRAANDLDFRTQPRIKRSHAVLDRALRWQREQALRNRRIRHAVRNLPLAMPTEKDARKITMAQLRVIQDRGRSAYDG